MGEVYRAQDTRLKRAVAVKVLPAHLSDDPDLRQRFEQEAHAVSSLNHPHICTLHDVGRQDGLDFLVMEYLEGETLARRLEKGGLSLKQALQYAIEMASVLEEAHSTRHRAPGLEAGQYHADQARCQAAGLWAGQVGGGVAGGSPRPAGGRNRRREPERERIDSGDSVLYVAGAGRRQKTGCTL